AVVRGMGERRTAVRAPAGVREIQPGGFRRPVAHADARHPRRAGLPHSLHAGTRRLHGVTAPRHREYAAAVSGREPLGVETRQQRAVVPHGARLRSEEHTSELQSRENLVCRLLLEKKKKKRKEITKHITLVKLV